MSKESIFYPIKKILLPTDGSEVSLKAAKYAAEIAKRRGSKVTLLHVLEVPNIGSLTEIGSDLTFYRVATVDELYVKREGESVIERTKAS